MNLMAVTAMTNMESNDFSATDTESINFSRLEIVISTISSTTFSTYESDRFILVLRS